MDYSEWKVWSLPSIDNFSHHSRTIIKIKSNTLRIQFYFLVNLQTQDTMFKRKIFQRIVLVPVSSSIYIWFLWVPLQGWKIWSRKCLILKNMKVKTLKNLKGTVAICRRHYSSYKGIIYWTCIVNSQQLSPKYWIYIWAGTKW